MSLPFSIEEFFGVFRAYNEALWPAPVVLVALALAAIALVLRPGRASGVAIAAILAVLWTWLATAYHLAFFTRINPLAWGFAALSLAGAATFAWHGIVRRRLRFAWRGDLRALVGIALIVFALVVYPAWSWIAGHHYPSVPTFGLPCPSTIFTIGLLAFLEAPYPRGVFVVPLAWCLIGGQAAFLLGVHQDLGLVVAGIAGVVLMARSGAAAVSAETAP